MVNSTPCDRTHSQLLSARNIRWCSAGRCIQHTETQGIYSEGRNGFSGGTERRVEQKEKEWAEKEKEEVDELQKTENGINRMKIREVPNIIEFEFPYEEEEEIPEEEEKEIEEEGIAERVVRQQGRRHQGGGHME